VYNPFDVLLLLQERQFRSWWFETGMPTFLVDLLKSRQTFAPQQDAWGTSEPLPRPSDAEHIATEAVLWQSGYLTIQAEQPVGDIRRYVLGYPNQEVESAFHEARLTALLLLPDGATSRVLPLYRALHALDWPALRTHVEALFASIPADWCRANPVLHGEVLLGQYLLLAQSRLAESRRCGSACA